MNNPEVTSHERFEGDLAELAAGVLDRQEETALLNHLAFCPSCVAKFEQLASAAKSLLLLVLEIEPPAGFDSRLKDRIESDSCEPDSCRAIGSHAADAAPVWPQPYPTIGRATMKTPDEALAQRTDPSKLQRFVRWVFFNRRTGGITVGQWPNLALAAFAALSIARRFNIPKGAPETTLRLLAEVALIVWATDELIRGVNPFRRILGLVVILVMMSRIALWAR